MMVYEKIYFEAYANYQNIPHKNDIAQLCNVELPWFEYDLWVGGWQYAVVNPEFPRREGAPTYYLSRLLPKLHENKRNLDVCPGFEKVDPFLACFIACVQWIPQIHLWYNGSIGMISHRRVYNLREKHHEVETKMWVGQLAPFASANGMSRYI